MIRVLYGDCLLLLPTLEADSIDAVVTDPPYGLEFMGKEWDAPWKGDWQSAAGFSKPGIGERKTAWPSSAGSAANATCATCGGRMRGAKKCKCGEPDWRVKGQAPDPKHQRHGQMQTFQVWSEAWAREVLRVLKPGGHMLAFGGTRTFHRMVCAIEDAGFEIRDSLCWLYGSGFPKSLDVSKAIDKAAGVAREDKFEGAFERRAGPTGNKRCDTCGKWLVSGTPCQCPRPQDAPITSEAAQWDGWGTALKPAFEPIVLARKPLIGTVVENVLMHGTGGINVDACRIETDDNQSRPRGSFPHSDDVWGNGRPGEVSVSNPAGRWPANVVHDGSDEVMAAFAAFGERGGFAPVSGMEPSNPAKNTYGKYGRVPGAFHNDTGTAARFFYCAKAGADDRAGSKHPTIKPLALMDWLVKLVTPPGGTLLDPFAGSGTTLLAADRLRFNAIGIEQSATYVADIKRRLHLDAGLFAEVTT